MEPAKNTMRPLLRLPPMLLANHRWVDGCAVGVEEDGEESDDRNYIVGAERVDGTKNKVALAACLLIGVVGEEDAVASLQDLILRRWSYRVDTENRHCVVAVAAAATMQHQWLLTRRDVHAWAWTWKMAWKKAFDTLGLV